MSSRIEIDVVIPDLSEIFGDEETPPLNPKQESSSEECQLSDELIYRHKAIAQRQIFLVIDNPFTEAFGKAMERNKQKILKLMAMASNTFDDDVDSEWLTAKFDAMNLNQNCREDMDYCRNYVLKLATDMQIEAHFRQNSDNLIMRKMRQLRLKENERDKVVPKPLIRDRSSSRKRSYRDYKPQPKVEEKPIAVNVVKNDESDDDRYYRKAEPIDDMFAKSPSPEPQPPPDEEKEEEDNLGLGHDDNGTSLDDAIDDEHAINSRTVDIDKRQPPTEPQGPTKRQLLVERLGNHIKGDHVNMICKPQKTGQRWEELQQMAKHNQAKVPRKKNQKTQIVRTPVKTKIQRPLVEVDDEDTSSEDDDYEFNEEPSSSSAVESSFEIIYRSPLKLSTVSGLKSCLKKRRRNANKKNLCWDADTLFVDCYRPPNLEYKRQWSVTIYPKTTIFTTKVPALITSIENISVSVPSSSSLLKRVPSSDQPVKIAKRDNPLKRTARDITQIEEEIYNEFNNLKSSFSERFSRLFIVDSILAQLNKEIFTNMVVMPMGYPRMPEWFVDALKKWWKTGKKHMFFSKVFILCGMDLILNFVHEKDELEQIPIRFLIDIENFFKNKLEEVRNSLRVYRDQSPYMLTWTKRVLPFDDPKCQDIDVIAPRLLYQPEFVVITIPEIGHFSVFFRDLNVILRKFVNAHSESFTLLDWAVLVKKKYGDETMINASTVEQRTDLLIQTLRSEHGVTYK